MAALRRSNQVPISLPVTSSTAVDNNWNPTIAVPTNGIKRVNPANTPLIPLAIFLNAPASASVEPGDVNKPFEKILDASAFSILSRLKPSFA